MRYEGSCHCQAVRFEVEADLAQVIECNCSHCSIKGLLLAFVPADRFTLLSGEGELTEYRFNKKVIAHLFCRRCGVEAFARGSDPKTGGATVAVNVRSLAGVDLETIVRAPFDGKHLM
jgi:hypothetical protein